MEQSVLFRSPNPSVWTAACPVSAVNGKVAAPTDTTIDSGGNLWVTDYTNYRVQELTNAGVYITKFGSGGNPDTTNGQFGGAGDPEGISIP